MAPSAENSSNTVDMNMAGVEARPQSNTQMPREAKVSEEYFFKEGPVRRESMPIAIFISEKVLFTLIFNHSAKAVAIFTASILPRFTSSPPGIFKATPLMSLPFCNFFIVITAPLHYNKRITILYYNAIKK